MKISDYPFSIPENISGTFYVSKKPYDPESPKDQPRFMTIESGRENCFDIFIWKLTPTGRAKDPSFIACAKTLELAEAIFASRFEGYVFEMSYAT